MKRVIFYIVILAAAVVTTRGLLEIGAAVGRLQCIVEARQQVPAP